MKLAIIGYGRMGHRIEEIAKERGHEIVARIDADNVDDIDSHAFKSADVAIEFTTPATAVDCILRSFASGVPVVSGTTGWQNELPELREMCLKGAGTLLYSSNYSVGVNIFMAVNTYLASLLSKFPTYKPSITEVHHVHKLDHPSGTAVSLANGIMAADPNVTEWAEPDAEGKVAEGAMPIAHQRIGEVPGIHTVEWRGPNDCITIRHEAFSRDGFATGAVIAAEWLKGKKGFFTFADVLQLPGCPSQH